MYKLLLILKYLRKRRIAWVSLIAVTLCTAMVLVVISIMGGWLHMFLDTNHAVGGDVVIYKRGSPSGFGNYQQILDAVGKLPQVKTAIPVITSFGLANIANQYQANVQVKAFGDLTHVGEVTSFQRGLYRQYQEQIEAIDSDNSLSAAEKQQRKDAVNSLTPSFDKPLDADTYRTYLPGKNGFDTSKLPGLIAGTPLIMQKDKDGHYDRGDFIYHAWVKLTVADLTSLDSSTPDVSTGTYWIVDDCRTGLYQVDVNTVYVPFDKLQQSLGMGVRYAPDGKTVVEPAHVSEIEIALNPGVDLYQGRDAVQKAVEDLETAQVLPDVLQVESWDQHQAQFISAVVHEKVLLTFLFSIISIVAVFLVFCIFFMIVVEKTRDIGIIKSVGASNWGVAQIFLGYGLTIGLLGAGMGLLSAYLIIHNINAIHAWMGRAMGIKIWDPQTYIFDTIPNTMDPHDVTWIVTIAVLSALVGALVPAFRAAD